MAETTVARIRINKRFDKEAEMFAKLNEETRQSTLN